MSLLAASLVALSVPLGVRVPACVAQLCQPAELDPWFRKLAHSDQKPGARPLHILQIGDSHTAGDAITGAWRRTLQARYGSGGRGVLPPGLPYRGFVASDVSVSMSPDWTIKASSGPLSAAPRPPIGVTGFSASTSADGAWMALSTEPGVAFNRFIVCALTGPGAGVLTISTGTMRAEFNLSSFAIRPECRTVRPETAQRGAIVTANGGPVTITSWAGFRDTGGVALSNVGIVGAQFSHFSRTDEAVVAEELRAYDPDLIVIAFGTNEGFSPRLEPGQYELVLRSQIARVRRLAPNVPLLMLGAPDAGTRNTALSGNAPGEAIDCNVREASLDDIMADLRASAEAGEGATTPVDPESDPARRPLFIPPGMAAVRAVQRKVAADLGIAFWDWAAAMGGACSAVRHVRADPPLIRGDFVHYTKAGGAEIARLLDADLADAAAARVGK